MACTGTPCARCWPTRSRRGTGDRVRPEDPSLSPTPASSTGSWRTISGVPGSSATPPSASSSLRDEHGYDGGYTTVKDYVRENRRQTREMFVPLSHAPGRAQSDFGEALVVIGAVEWKAHCFVLDPAPQRREGPCHFTGRRTPLTGPAFELGSVARFLCKGTGRSA